MSIETSAKKPAGPTISDIERGLAQWGTLKAELEDLTRQREELKSILEYHEIVKQLPALRTECEAAKAERDTAQIEAQEFRDQARADGEAEKQRLVAEGEAVKSQATQAAARIIADAKRQAILEASEASAQERRLLVDREARVGVREREVATALRPYREARGRLLAATDAVEKIPTMILKTGEA